MNMFEFLMIIEIVILIEVYSKINDNHAFSKLLKFHKSYRRHLSESKCIVIM